MQLSSSRKPGGGAGTPPPRGGGKAAAGSCGMGSILSSLMGLSDEPSRRHCGHSDAPHTELRASFVQEALLSALAQPCSGLDYGPLDASLDGPHDGPRQHCPPQP